MKHLVALMTPQDFAQRSGLIKGGLLQRRHSRLNEIYQALMNLPPKTQVQRRWSALRRIAALCAVYLGKKDPSGVLKDPRFDAVLTLRFQALARVNGEQERANLLYSGVTAQPTQLRPGRYSPGKGVALQYTWEKAIKDPTKRMHGQRARQMAEAGLLGNVEFEGADWKEVRANDLYALKALFKGLEWQRLEQEVNGLKNLHYLTGVEREERRLQFFARKAIYNYHGQPADTSQSIIGRAEGASINAASQDGDLYTIEVFDAARDAGYYHHSSLLAGEEVMCAGTIKIIRGKLIFISNDSGHYQPGLDELLDVCIAIKAQYDDYEEAFAEFSDFQGVLAPKVGGFVPSYLIPMKEFILAKGRPDNPGDYTGEFQFGQPWFRYYNPQAAWRRGGLRLQLIGRGR